jgi:hypothetical protein
MRQAVADKAVVPLLYEGRLVELEADQAQLDRWFERHTQGLSDEQKADLKHKMSREDVVSEADRRIKEIAYNLSEHFAHNFKDRQSGFKAMLATSSKPTALRYKKYLDECGLLTSEVVISGPDTREGHEDTDPDKQPEVQKFWARMMERFSTDEAYNREIIEDFARSDGVDLLIVVNRATPCSILISRSKIMPSCRRLPGSTGSSRARNSATWWTIVASWASSTRPSRPMMPWPISMPTMWLEQSRMWRLKWKNFRNGIRTCGLFSTA